MAFLRSLIAKKGNTADPDPCLQVLNLDVYECTPIMINYSCQISCIAAYDDCLIIGTEDGNILKRTQNEHLSKPKFETLLVSSEEKKPIVQIEALPELGILISLNDNLIILRSLHAKSSAQLPLVVEGTRGATAFATNTHYTRTNDGHDILKVCVVIKNNLRIFCWKEGNFHKHANDLKLPEIPKAVAWFNDCIWVCLRNEYTVVDYKTGTPTEKFSVGKHRPLIVPLEFRNELALGFGKTTGLVNSNVGSSIDSSLCWAIPPITILDDTPYLVALSERSVIEVQTDEPRLVVQRIADLPHQSGRSKLLVKCTNRKGTFFVASSSDVYCLTPKPLSHQIQQFVREKHFKLALNLNEESDETKDCKYQRTKEIENEHALDCFERKEFENSLKIFQSINANPTIVLDLFSELLSYDQHDAFDSSHLSTIQQKKDELKGALESLIVYLLDARSHTRDKKKLRAFWPDLTSGDVEIKKIQLKQMIDTALLKCYLKTNDARVASLTCYLDNHCLIDESELALKHYRKYNELRFFYETKGLHKKALDLLKTMSAQSDPLLSGPEPTVNYLKRLGSKHLDLILNYATWVIQQHPEDGLKIFLDSARQETEHLPTNKVIEYLERKNETLVIPYLEHKISNGSGSTRALEFTLSNKYAERVQALISDYFYSIRKRRANRAHGSEREELDVHERFSLLREAIGLKVSSKERLELGNFSSTHF
ncbi:Vam6/Vps39-like protein [Halotydeus destructor]|nr:Vam6/Vps39-like protein [Halotydeus destructor]